MNNDDENQRISRARNLRKYSKQDRSSQDLKSTPGEPVPDQETSKDQSPREFIHRKMREDQKK